MSLAKGFQQPKHLIGVNGAGIVTPVIDGAMLGLSTPAVRIGVGLCIAIPESYFVVRFESQEI